MLGSGVFKGLGVTLKNLVTSYFVKERLVTVQYPEERIGLKERYRNFPFLVYDGTPENIRCTACKICEKECPPKCIAIVQDSDAQGRPIRQPKAFDIDFSVCMNCGICEEVCPFDSIFMDHKFEIAESGRFEELIYTKNKLLESADYLMKIRPTDALKIQTQRKQKEAAKNARASVLPAVAKPNPTPSAPGSGSAVAKEPETP